MKNLILVEFGAPSDQNELREFLHNLHGREPGIPELESASRKYVLSGGSPIRSKMQALRERLAGILDASVDYAFLYNKPYLADVVDASIRSGFKDIVILPLFTFYSRRTSMDIDKCANRDAKIKVVQAYRIPCLADVWGNRLKSDINGLRDFMVVFTAHSIPASESDQYAESFRELAKKISASAGCTNYITGFQNSRRGWLGPSIYDLQPGPARNIVVVPLSFLLTNMEILYDLDIEYSQHIRQTGHTYIRSGPPDEGYELPACLASVV